MRLWAGLLDRDAGSGVSRLASAARCRAVMLSGVSR